MGFLDFLFGDKKKGESEAPAHTKSEPQRNNASKSIENIIGKYYSLSQLRAVPMGQIVLRPIDAGLVVDEESKSLICSLAASSPKIAQFLPNLDLSSSDAISKYFLKYCDKVELGYEFGYSICLADGFIIGFVFIHTPACNEKAIGFSHWTIDFCLFSVFEKQGLMRQLLPRVLYLLKTEFRVNELYAYVDESNTDCLKLLSSLPFDPCPETLTDPASGNVARLFCCPLHEINFQRG